MLKGERAFAYDWSMTKPAARSLPTPVSKLPLVPLAQPKLHEEHPTFTKTQKARNPNVDIPRWQGSTV